MASILTPNTAPTANSGQKKTGVTAPTASALSVEPGLPYVASPSIVDGTTTATPSAVTAVQTPGSNTASSTPKSDGVLYNTVERTGGPLTENDIQLAVQAGYLKPREAAELMRQIAPKAALVADDEDEDDAEEDHHLGFGDGEEVLALDTLSGQMHHALGIAAMAKIALAARSLKKAAEGKRLAKEAKGRRPLSELSEKEAAKAEAALEKLVKKSGSESNKVVKELTKADEAAQAADHAEKAAGDVMHAEKGLMGLKNTEKALTGMKTISRLAGVTKFLGGSAVTAVVAAAAAPTLVRLALEATKPAGESAEATKEMATNLTSQLYDDETKKMFNEGNFGGLAVKSVKDTASGAWEGIKYAWNDREGAWNSLKQSAKDMADITVMVMDVVNDHPEKLQALGQELRASLAPEVAPSPQAPRRSDLKNEVASLPADPAVSLAPAIPAATVPNNGVRRSANFRGALTNTDEIKKTKAGQANAGSTVGAPTVTN